MKKWIIAYCLVGLVWAIFAAKKQYEYWPETPVETTGITFVVNTVLWPISAPIGVWQIVR